MINKNKQRSQRTSVETQVSGGDTFKHADHQAALAEAGPHAPKIKNQIESSGRNENRSAESKQGHETQLESQMSSISSTHNQTKERIKLLIKTKLLEVQGREQVQAARNTHLDTSEVRQVKKMNDGESNLRPCDGCETLIPKTSSKFS
jgi:hypothetical protein